MNTLRISMLMAGLAIGQVAHCSTGFGPDSLKGPRKVRDVIIYEDARFYSTFPSVVKKKDGEILVAFRRAPERKNFGEKSSNHVDPNSYLVTVKSKDGVTWTQEPELLYAHPFGGSQDPCLLQLKDGTLLCASYGWGFLRPDGMEKLKQPYFETSGAVFLGGYILRSTDGAKTWKGPIYPPRVQPEINLDPFGKPVAAYNRGAMYEGKDGRVFWVIAASESNKPRRTSNHLLVSEDKGMSWKYSSVVAADEKASFNETSIYETPKGDLVAFLRTAEMDDQACIARSTDGGKTFGKWEQMGFQGHPMQAMRLPDKRVLLVYGYRHKPYGIRARVLNAECTDFAASKEIVLREDGGGGDIGYPWAVQLNPKEVLVTYYFNIGNGTRHIAGTILQTGN
ncbi:MAG TPA: sialidase family protein [Dyadobacter sp.]|nr:sialidase family protein [Dyadobacter sp.]